MANTIVVFYQGPLNIDDLMMDLRLQIGDLDGTHYSDPVIRTALVSAVKMLGNRWNSKYQIYHPDMFITESGGYILANTIHGQGYIPAGLEEGDIFRNPFIQFNSVSPPIIEEVDASAIVIQARILLRSLRLSSSAGTFISIATEDLKYSNLAAERTITSLLEEDIRLLNDLFKTKIAKPKVSSLQYSYIPRSDIVYPV